jgi:hypothetical protein
VNYLCHGRAHLDEPWTLAGTALPDWLGASDRRSRVDRARAEEMAQRDDDSGAIARGVLTHLADDRWFHATEVFDEVTVSITRDIRAAWPDRRRLRASFLGHVMMEMLLDATLDEERPGAMDSYYDALGEIDPARVQAIAEALCPRPPRSLGRLVPLFLHARFLHGYREDAALVRRLNGLCSRVGLPRLPDGFVELVGPARELVRLRAHELLEAP